MCHSRPLDNEPSATNSPSNSTATDQLETKGCEATAVDIVASFGDTWWTDSAGRSVHVQESGSSSSRLFVVLSKGGRKDIHLSIRQEGQNWRCGKGSLVKLSTESVTWSMPDGNVSVWTRRHPLQACSKTTMLEPLCFLAHDESKVGVNISEDESTTCASPVSMSVDLSGCCSPSDAFFDPPCVNAFPAQAFNQQMWHVPDYGDASNVWTPQSFPMISNGSRELLRAPQRSRVPPELVSRVWQYSKQQVGCREVQRALEESDRETCVAIAAELRGQVWEAVEHSQANFVLQRCVEKLSSHGSQWIIEEILSWGEGSAVYLAKHRFGCRIFERLLEHCTAEQVKPLVDDILGDAVKTLCADPFANYVFQHLLEHGAEDQRKRLVDVLIDNIEWMSTDYHAAGVVSHALVHCSAEEKHALGSALLHHPARLVEMATHRFGHVTIERLLQLQIPGQEKVRDLLAAKSAMLRSSKYGRKVEKCLQASRPCHATAAASA